MLYTRIEEPNEVIQQEFEKLMDEWMVLDSDVSFAEYRDTHASSEALQFLQEVREAHKWAEKHDVFI